MRLEELADRVVSAVGQHSQNHLRVGGEVSLRRRVRRQEWLFRVVGRLDLHIDKRALVTRGVVRCSGLGAWHESGGQGRKAGARRERQGKAGRGGSGGCTLKA